MTTIAVVVALLAVLLVWWTLSFGAVIALGIACALVYVYFPWRKRVATKEEAQHAVKNEYDYIIVGGGAAGCVLANRLTANKKKPRRVLVLEGGHPNYDDLKFRIPASAPDLCRSDSDWNLLATDELQACRDGGMVLSCGKVLGGSSSIRPMLYNRGDAHDYDIWENDFKCKGWNASANLPFFRRSHYDQSGRYESDAMHHGKIGELFVDNVQYLHRLSTCFLDACKSAGLPSNDDFNTWKKSQEGFGRYTMATRNGERVSAASAFLSAAQSDSSRNLTVLSGAIVHRVLFDRNRNAIGVEVRVEDGSRHLARVKHDDKERGEVLLTAGALRSPQLLMLSGVGPASHLSQHEIPLVFDLPSVGECLQDQPAVNVEFESALAPSSTPSVTIFGIKIPRIFSILKWWRTRSGPLTSPGYECGGFVRTAAAQEGSPSPDLQMCFLPARHDQAKRQRRRGMTFQCIATRPHSRGCVRLSGKRFSDVPSIIGGYFSDSRDLASIREGIRLARTIAQQPSFADSVGKEISPGKTVASESQLDEFILSKVYSAAAFAGTCRMGPFGSDAVCDTEMRVRGVAGVRVCDASVLPKLPGGQITATTLMIAERAAEVLLNPPARKAEGPAWPPIPAPPMDPEEVEEILYHDKELRDALHEKWEASHSS